jgi:hypothetical protein
MMIRDDGRSLARTLVRLEYWQWHLSRLVEHQPTTRSRGSRDLEILLRSFLLVLMRNLGLGDVLGNLGALSDVTYAMSA